MFERPWSVFTLMLLVSLMTGACSQVALMAAEQAGHGEVKVAAGWDPPQSVGAPINTAQWEDSPSISPDGNTLYFSRGTDRNVDIYYSKKQSGGWGEPVRASEIGVKNFPTGAAHSQNDKLMYLSSMRPGVIGGADIFVCERVDGKWSNLKNLGEPVNTAEMESEPYISPDDNTLYFASNRRGGRGKADIYVAKKNGNKWGIPTNIGIPVNSAEDDTQPFLTDDGKELYFQALNRKGVPGPAIFRSLKQGDSWSEPELVVSGFVGEPTLTKDKKYLYFVHIILSGGKLAGAEIMYTGRSETGTSK
jgi:Tol biopolymer transport system component